VHTTGYIIVLYKQIGKDDMSHMKDFWIQRVEQVDLTDVLARVVTETGWDEATLQQAAQEYRNFLVLKGLYPHQAVSPTALADVIWHEHITHTRKYFADCDAIFGEYLHHTPKTEEDTTGLSVLENVQLYQQEFGMKQKNGAIAPCA
jgi:hypothetical protein